MTHIPAWWNRPRRITVVVDNPSWVVPFAERLVSELRAAGDAAVFAREYNEIENGAVAFYLGCLHIAPPGVLARNQRNLVVHASDLPKGRGFSPLTWQILEGKNDIPICLLEAVGKVDAGSVVYREWIKFEGHELLDELQKSVGDMSVALCRRYLDEPTPRAGEPQVGAETTYPRRRPADSRMDLEKSVADQFNLFRVVDNGRYPAWFECRGHRYKIKIEKMD